MGGRWAVGAGDRWKSRGAEKKERSREGGNREPGVGECLGRKRSTLSNLRQLLVRCKHRTRALLRLCDLRQTTHISESQLSYL